MRYSWTPIGQSEYLLPNDLTSVGTSRDPTIGPNNIVTGYKSAHVLRGTLLPDPENMGDIDSAQADLNLKIKEFEDNFNIRMGLGKLLLDDGSPSEHQIDYANSLSGTRVDYRWVDATNVEFATQRSFEIRIEGEFELLEGQGNPNQKADTWREDITTIGTNTERWAIITVLSGSPVIQQTAEKTPIRITQRGQAVNRTLRDVFVDPNGYPNAFAPIYTDGPTLVEIKERRNISNFGPEPGGGENTPINYGTRWSYEYMSSDTVTRQYPSPPYNT